jgi:hypothetical protein
MDIITQLTKQVVNEMLILGGDLPFLGWLRGNLWITPLKWATNPVFFVVKFHCR